MSVKIHPTAIVSPHARLGADVEIGPFCVVEEDTQIGDRTHLRSSVVIGKGARIGHDCAIYPGAVIATEPQDLKYDPSRPSYVFIGDRTTIRECATVNRGTHATGKTTVGSDCLIMAYCHVAHDCTLGDKVIMSNSTQLAGHVTIGYHATLGGNTLVHQFCSVGDHVMTGANTMIRKDVAPYLLVAGDPCKISGVNKIGLQRRGFTDEEVAGLRDFYNLMFRGGKPLSAALTEYELNTPSPLPSIENAIRAIRSSTRGIYTR